MTLSVFSMTLESGLVMPITRYDEPFKLEPLPGPSKRSFEIRNYLIQNNIIPEKGKAPLTLELVQNIITAKKELFWDELSDEGKSLETLSDELDIPFKVYCNFKARHPENVKVSPKFIDDLIGDQQILAVGKSFQAALEMGLPEAKSLEPSPTEKCRLKSIECDLMGEYNKALEYLNTAVEMRADIEPLLNRANFLFRHNRIDKALSDYELCLKEAHPAEYGLAIAYVNKGLCLLAKNMVEPALESILAGFEWFHKLPKAVFEDEDDIRHNNLGYCLERSVPKLKQLEKQTQTSLSEKGCKTLESLKSIILYLRQRIDY